MMGLLIDGIWHDNPYDTSVADESPQHGGATFRRWLTADGGTGPDGQPGHKAEAGRYRLYISHACPWAHSAMIMHALKGLESAIPISVAHWRKRERGWTFETGAGVIPDPIISATYLYQLYALAQPDMTGRATLPMLWDQVDNQIINNESTDILRMLNTAFDGIGARAGDYYPSSLRDAIDGISNHIYIHVSRGVYRAGFATTQRNYENAVYPLFETLDWLETHLMRETWLVGDQMTEADIRLFATLIRFDSVYHGHFKCNLRRIADYPALHDFVARMMAIPEIRATVHFDHIKRHCYESHRYFHFPGIVPVGPALHY